MSKLDKLIEKLPDELHDIARRYAKLVEDQTDGWIKGFAAMLATGDTQAGYEAIVSVLTTEELGAEHRRANEKIKDFVTTGGKAFTTQQVMVGDALHVMLTMLGAAIRG